MNSVSLGRDLVRCFFLLFFKIFLNIYIYICICKLLRATKYRMSFSRQRKLKEIWAKLLLSAAAASASGSWHKKNTIALIAAESVTFDRNSSLSLCGLTKRQSAFCVLSLYLWRFLNVLMCNTWLWDNCIYTLQQIVEYSFCGHDNWRKELWSKLVLSPAASTSNFGHVCEPTERYDWIIISYHYHS